MMNAMYISAIGLQAQKEQLDVVANNLANIGTTAFKQQSRDFASMLDRVQLGSAAPAAASTDVTLQPSLRFNMTQGEVHATGRPLDIAIVGAGFLQVQLPGDQIGYSRNGALQIGADGVVTLAGGQPLSADVRVPNGANDVRVLSDGSVTAVLEGDTEPTVLGQIELATFSNPERLQYLGDGIYIAPEDLEPARSRPGEEGTSTLAVQSLETSNVRMTEEMVSLLLMQRIYELNARVLQVADEMVGMSNNLRRA